MTYYVNDVIANGVVFELCTCRGGCDSMIIWLPGGLSVLCKNCVHLVILLDHWI